MKWSSIILEGAYMPVVRIGIKGLTFDAATFTAGEQSKCYNLHGHTYSVDVEVEGEINEETGMVMDFLVLKRIVKSIIDEYDHVVIIPRKYEGSVELRGPFKSVIKYIDKPQDTAEYLALDIAEKLFNALKMKIKVTLYEGNDKYASVEYP
jgi:6-pyruvoyltetrahydropterin/6-carboxytetrahydropterin synthase